MKHLLIAIIGLLMSLPALASTSLAAMTEKDALIIARIINLLQNRPENNVEIVVVANTPKSHADANDFLSFIAQKSHQNGINLTASVISPEELAATTANVIVIPDSFDRAQFDMVFAIAQEKKLATISTSDVCLMAQRCAIAFKSDPAVDIRISQTAAAATGVSFSPTLRMMIKEMP